MEIFISMGFKGRTYEEIIKRRDEIIKILVNDYHINGDISFIDNFVKEIPNDIKKESVWCLGDSIRLLSWADLVVFDKDYWMFNGCQTEYDVCVKYDIPRLML